MNVYDFDKTIFYKDSSVEFYKFCLKKHKRVLRAAGCQIGAFLSYAFKRIDKTEMKQRIYRYFMFVPDIDATVAEFWLKNGSNFNKWYFERRKPDDVIISASPSFLLEPAMKLLNVNCLIASEVDKFTGEYTGLNCYGEEKVKRFTKQFPRDKIQEFYSDSKSDTPLAKISQKAYIVSGEKLAPWKF